MFYRIGDCEAVSFDPQSVVTRLMYDAASQKVRVCFREGSPATIEATHEDFASYVQFIASCQPLVRELQARSLRTILSEQSHPELEEMPRALFTLFQSFPGSDTLELRLTPTGAGSLWTKGEHARCVLSWDDFQQGVYRLIKRNVLV